MFSNSYPPPLFDIAHVHSSQFSCMESLTWIWGGGGENADCSIAVLGFNVQITSGISVPENNSYSSPTIVHEITCTVLLFHFFFSSTST